MNLDGFLYNLHFDVESVRAVDVKVDWEDAPLPFKIYQDTQQLQLPLVLSSRRSNQYNSLRPANLNDIAALLWYSYGLSQLTQNYIPSEGSPYGADLVQTLRRFVPSGGALYPNELYVYLNIDEDTRGIYHYDVSRHSLSLLREGQFGSYLSEAMGGRYDFSASMATLFVSTLFWKNYFKYHDFSYRLQGIDAGALLGQITLAAQCLGFSSTVKFQFLDRALNDLLGLSEDMETVYAVVPLSKKDAKEKFLLQQIRHPIVHSEDLQRKMDSIQPAFHIKSREIGPYPNIIALNQAAMHDSTADFQMDSRPREESEGTAGQGVEMTLERVKLPVVKNLDFDFAKACRRRYSPGLDFRFAPVSLQDFAALLQESMTILHYAPNLYWQPRKSGTADGGMNCLSAQRLALGVSVHGIAELKDGAYVYDPVSHELHLRNQGDQRSRLQSGMSMQNVNLLQTPLCFHILGQANHLYPSFGYRGHRMQHMEAGMLLQKLLLTAAALGMNGHPLLDYDETLCDEIYNSLAINKTTLVQIPIGYYRSVARLQTTLYG